MSYEKSIRKELFFHFSKNIKKPLAEYKFDTHVDDSFAKRIARENGVSLEVAKVWIELYKLYIVYVGWLFISKNKVKKPKADLYKYLIIPYEILQVWREHVLFTEKYSELSRIVTQNSRAFIPFAPPKIIWKKTKIEKLLNFFRINRNILKVLTDSKHVDSLFVFQSSYMKNLVHFNVKESDSNFANILKRYQEEVSDPRGIFALQSRTLTSLSSLVDRLMEIIISSIKKEDYSKNEWQLNKSIQGPAREKLDSFRNTTLHTNFLQNYSQDHLTSYAKSDSLINEYKKFLYLANVTNQVQCPSEEVDSVWHYHLTHVIDYLEFSSLKMGRKIFIHNPNNGSEEDKATLPDVYKLTLQNLQNYFGNVNRMAWPDRSARFQESPRWFNHQSLMQKCLLSKGKLLENSEAKNIVAGCTFGCGNIFGGADTMGCGTLSESNDSEEINISGCTGNTWCCGNCASGCLGGDRGCGSKVTGVGVIHDS